ncbi:hypothetical protein [Calderihabitans maritimus]|nr:hypothetical protein [Calderihabitans maritimus]
MKRAAGALILLMAFLAVGCSMSTDPTEYDGTVASPLQVETFDFQYKKIVTELRRLNQMREEALNQLLNGESTKFDANAVFRYVKENAQDLLQQAKEMEAPGHLVKIKEVLVSSFAYYMEGLSDLREYLDKEKKALLEEADGNFQEATRLLDEAREKLEKAKKIAGLKDDKPW